MSHKTWRTRYRRSMGVPANARVLRTVKAVVEPWSGRDGYEYHFVECDHEQHTLRKTEASLAAMGTMLYEMARQKGVQDLPPRPRRMCHECSDDEDDIRWEIALEHQRWRLVDLLTRVGQVRAD